MADISGIWLGTYWQKDQPTRFEATFVQSGNALTGNILDDNQYGDARVAGDVSGRSISFVKEYVVRKYAVTYSGTLSEDENHISGSWTIRGIESGQWEARRSGDNLTLDLDILAARSRDLAGASSISSSHSADLPLCREHVGKALHCNEPDE